MAEATALLAEYARTANQEAVVLTAGGTPVAVLIPVEGVDLESLALSTHPDFLALIERSRLRQQAEGGLSSAEMRRRLGLSTPTTRDGATDVEPDREGKGDRSVLLPVEETGHE